MIFLAILVGLIIGSFLNVCIYRLPRGLSVVSPRSLCPSCTNPIPWYDNIPVISYLVLRGRCRHCSASISWRYPVVELLTAGLFAIAISNVGLTVELLRPLVFGSLLICLLFTDLECRLLPDSLTLGGTLAGFVLAIADPLPAGILAWILRLEGQVRLASLLDSVVAAFVCAGMLWTLGVAYRFLRGREGLGLGDVKMVAMIGSFQGLERAILILAVGSVFGSVIGGLYLLVTRKDPGSFYLPFGSFLAAGGLAYLVWDLIWH